MEVCCWSFRVQNAQTLGTWLTAYFHLHHKTGASLLELRRFISLGGLGGPNNPYHWLAATGILGLSTHGSIIKTQDNKINL